MATANILAKGTTEASSSTFTVAAGSTVTLSLSTGTNGPAPVNTAATVELQGSGANWHPVGELTYNNQAASIATPGTYRVTRHATGASFGVDLTT